ncbi:hypothetical protein ACFL27_10840 [candidate division CSSED10-310 bacterium]|uniref:Glutamate synthase alpha subunit C-terminal domain-containing protein n=1 Tax=candidate division CSSED10-310 bacterium TaxID=2855610 RepID=A0ABV6YWT8_UNCC1
MSARENKSYHFSKSFQSNPRRLRDMISPPARKLAAPGQILNEPPSPFSTEDEVHVSFRKELRLWGELAEKPKEQQWALKLRTDLKNEALSDFMAAVNRATLEIGSLSVLRVLTFLLDRRWDIGFLKRSQVVALLNKQIGSVLDALPDVEEIAQTDVVRVNYQNAWSKTLPDSPHQRAILVINSLGFPAEGSQAVSRLLVQGYQKGWRKFITYNCRGDRFIGCGLGPNTDRVRIDVYGSSGDYLGSGMDGGQIIVHGAAQDQVGQILTAGKIVIFGDVGQTFLYGAKGGEAYVMGNAAGRPLINAVGRIRAIINGTCLDYCAESFMAGRELDDGFVIINGITFDRQGAVIGLETKYPGNNLFSMASGGACYLNDPYRTVKTTQLNGAVFIPFRQKDWNVIIDYLRFNEMLFGLSIRHDLLLVDGVLKWPKEVFRKVVASPKLKNLDWSTLPD